MRNPYANQEAEKAMKRVKLLSTLLPILPYILMGVTVLVIIAITAFNVNADKLMKLYSSLNVDKSVNSIDKRYSFVSAYTYATGDISFAMAAGYTEEEAEDRPDLSEVLLSSDKLCSIRLHLLQFLPSPNTQL